MLYSGYANKLQKNVYVNDIRYYSTNISLNTCLIITLVY